jgi:hypothetical protein
VGHAAGEQVRPPAWNELRPPAENQE